MVRSSTRQDTTHRLGYSLIPQGIDFPPIPDHPTLDDARAAFALLSDLVDTFPFIDGVDLAVALSAILTTPVRRSLPSAPLHALTAPVAGSGKSKLVDIASMIATGRPAGVISQGASAEEFEKQLGSVLLAADPIIAIDNCETALGGELLCQCLTQTTVQPRILGESRTPKTSTGAFITATGNNLVLIGDLTRRAILCRLDAKCERPELRTFDRDPVAHAKAKRPAFVVAVLTILHAFNVAGRPVKPAPLGSFEEWSGLIRGALLWLGCADPVDSMEAVRESDPRLRDLANAVEQWRTVIGAERVTVAEVIKRATEREQSSHGEQGFSNPDFREALLAVAGAGGAINSRRLGAWLSGVEGRIVDGCRFEQCGHRQRAVVWALRSA